MTTNRTSEEPRRPLALVWAVMAVMCIGNTAVIWIRLPAAFARPAFGRTESVIVELLAVFLTVSDVAVSYSARRATPLRWCLIVLIVAVIGLLVTAGLIELFTADSPTAVSMATAELVGAAAMGVVAWAVHSP